MPDQLPVISGTSTVQKTTRVFLTGSVVHYDDFRISAEAFEAGQAAARHFRRVMHGDDDGDFSGGRLFLRREDKRPVSPKADRQQPASPGTVPGPQPSGHTPAKSGFSQVL